MDEFTEAEPFRQLKATPGQKVIIRKEEASHFLNSYWEGHEKKTGLTLKGWSNGVWVYTRDDETTRQFIDNPAASLSGYSQPNPFVPIYVKLKERRDSRVDRMIVYNQAHIAWQPVRRESS